MAVHIHPIDLPSPYYKPIGQIAAGSNLTEVLMASIIWHFHNITDPNIGRLFTYYTNFEGKLRILKETLESRVPDPTLKAKLLTLHAEAGKLRQERNDFVHGLWGHMPGEPHKLKMFYLQRREKKTYLLKRKIVPLPDVMTVAARVRKLNQAFNKLMRENGIPPP